MGMGIRSTIVFHVRSMFNINQIFTHFKLRVYILMFIVLILMYYHISSWFEYPLCYLIFNNLPVFFLNAIDCITNVK